MTRLQTVVASLRREVPLKRRSGRVVRGYEHTYTLACGHTRVVRERSHNPSERLACPVCEEKAP